MHNVPFGSPNGLNVIFGGGIAFSPNLTPDGIATDLLDFKHIYIHDPATKTFHNQTTTGTRPSPRIRFCSVGTPGFNRSYEIFVYGGRNPSLPAQEKNLMSDQVFVLSLPSLVWFKADYPATSARMLQTCNICGSGGSQMVVVGGVEVHSLPDSTTMRSDPWINGINIFNLSAMRWEDRYESNDTPYQTPSVVRDWYAEKGPYPSWDSPAVESLFIKAAAPAPIPTSTPSSSSTSPSDRNTNTSAIAGGAIGSHALLVVIASVVYCMLKKRRAEGQSSGDHRPELEANINTYSRQSLFQENVVSEQELPETTLLELSSGEVLELPSGEERHEADTGSIRERYEMIASSTNGHS